MMHITELQVFFMYILSSKFFVLMVVVIIYMMNFLNTSKC